jgi:micrococcal nuclease
LAGAAVVAGGVALALALGRAAGAHDTTAFAGVVVSVADGDTLTVRDGDTAVKVRLLGIDAPEVAHDGEAADCGGEAAQTGLATLLPPGTGVTVVTDRYADPADAYGRTLAYVASADVADVALALLEAGLVEAWIPSGEPEPERWDEYQAAQKAAERAGQGSWALCGALGRP